MDKDIVMDKDISIRVMRDSFLKNKDKIFLIDSQNGREFTYQIIEHFSLQLASLLSQKGIKKKDRVAILLPNSIEFILFYFSCMQIGAIPVPINTHLATKDISHIILNSGAKLVVAGQEWKEQIKEIAKQEILNTFFLQTNNNPEEGSCSLFKEIAKYGSYHDISFKDINDDDSIIIVHTSGTTNLPKGVEFTYKHMISNALAFIETVQLNNSHRFYGILSLAYMAGFYNLMFVPFLAGGSIVIEKIFDFSVNLAFWKKIKHYQINALWVVPSIISSLLPFAYPKEVVNYYTENKLLVFSGTAPLPDLVKGKFEEKFGLRIHNTYGLSELLFISINSPSFSIQSGVGKVLPGCQVSVVDETGKELPCGQSGEIIARSLYRMRGYFDLNNLDKDPEDTSIFFHTGDIGFLDKDHFLYITDRKKDLIIRGGINISPAEIEEVIMNSRMVCEVAVIGVPDDLQGEKVVAVVHRGEDFSEARLLEYCRRFLSSFKVPEQFMYTTSFPRSVTGKIQKNTLKEMITSAPFSIISQNNT